MKKNLYEQPSSEVFSFELEKNFLDGTGDPWIVIDEAYRPDDDYYEDPE